MKEHIFGLSFEYETYPAMRFSLMKDTGIQREKISKHSLRMLEQSNIPHVLPIEVQEQDLIITLHYVYDAKRTLVHHLKSKNLDDYDYFQIINQILYPLTEASNYMLQEECFILDDRFVFVDSTTSLIYLTYIPLKEMPVPYDMYEQLNRVIRMIAACMTKNNQKYIEDIFQKAAQEKGIQFIKLFREELKRLITSLYSNNLSTYSEEDRSGRLEEQLNKPRRTKEKVVPEEPIADADLLLKNGEETESTEANKSLPPLSSRAKTSLYLLVVLLIAVVWRIYIAFPLKGMIYVSIGFSFLILNVAIVLHKFWRPTFKRKRRDRNKAEHKSEQRNTHNTAHKAAHKVDVDACSEQKIIEHQKSIEASRDVGKKQIIDMKNFTPEEQYYKQLPSQTQILPSMNETTLLQVNAHEQNSVQGEKDQELDQIIKVNQNSSAFLLDNKNNHKKITLRHFPFSIGRHAKNVSHIENKLGVSRVHFEINWQSDCNEYVITDLGSRNGTFVNGERITWNRPYKLRDRDIIRFATNEYIFRLEERGEQKDEHYELV